MDPGVARLEKELGERLEKDPGDWGQEYEAGKGAGRKVNTRRE